CSDSSLYWFTVPLGGDAVVAGAEPCAADPVPDCAIVGALRGLGLGWRIPEARLACHCERPRHGSHSVARSGRAGSWQARHRYCTIATRGVSTLRPVGGIPGSIQSIGVRCAAVTTIRRLRPPMLSG